MTAPPAQPDDVGGSDSRATVLLVDDDPAIRRALARLLVREGWTVVEAGSGAEGLAAVHRDAPDVVVTDLNMPEMNGIEFLLAIQDQDPGLPVIAISGGGRIPKDSLLEDANLLGAVEVMGKPFDPGSLIAAIRRHLNP